MIILYKNAARVGSYVDSIVQVAENTIASTLVEAAVESNRNYDCILPTGTSKSSQVIVCKLIVKVCDEMGVPKSDAIENVSPELYIRSDRGFWNVYHKDSRYLIPKNGAFPIQICTKERSNVMRAALVLDFIEESSNESVAQSEILLVLSKPPLHQKSFPFARIIHKTRAEEKGLSGKRCSPSKWLSSIDENHVLIPERSSHKVYPWYIHSLGSYRSTHLKPETIKSKRKREDDTDSLTANIPEVNVEAEFLKHQVKELQDRLTSVEHERDGLAKALRLLK
jgi:hypothetical protein